MDNLTHSLFALTVSRTSLSRAGRGTTAVLLLASNAPDVDIVATAGGSVKYLAWHRGVTHGPLGIVGLALVTAGLVWIGRRYADRPGATAGTRGTGAAIVPERDATFAMLVAVAMIGVLLHVLMDLPTSYGIRLLSPFSWRWFAVDWLPIVDIYLLIVLIAGMVFGRGSDAARRRNAVIVLTLMTANYGIRGVAHHEALVLAPQLFGPTMPPRCGPNESRRSPIDSWPRPLSAATTPAPRARCLVELAALPSFTSPFEWRIVAQMSNAFEVHDIDLLDPRFRGLAAGSQVPWRLTVRYPNVWNSAVDRAATTHLGQVFLGFSRFPAARSVVDQKGVTTVRWTDIRFTGGPLTPSQSLRPVNLFTATVRIGPDSRILQETLGR